MQKNTPTNLKRVIIPVLLLVMTLTCRVTLVSEYDPIVDKSASSIQKKIDSFLLTTAQNAGKPAGTHNANLKFYIDLEVELAALQIRVESRPQNEITIKQLGLLKSNVDNLKALHKKRAGRGLSVALVKPLRSIFHQIFRSILTYELAKKRGK